MSNSENISLWKKKAEIDYIPLFMALWLSLNAWLRDRYDNKNDRRLVDLLKTSDSLLKSEFAELMHQNNARAIRFKGNFAELFRALNDADIRYTRSNLQGEKISFENSIIEWSDNPIPETIRKTKYQKNKTKLDENLWIDEDGNRQFAAYIETVYQIRCVLFHGNLSPTPANERVIEALFVTLELIMKKV